MEYESRRRLRRIRVSRAMASDPQPLVEPMVDVASSSSRVSKGRHHAKSFREHRATAARREVLSEVEPGERPRAAYFRATGTGPRRVRRQRGMAMARSIGVERKSLSAQVADTLREMIISNTYTYGDPLRQD